MFLIAVIMIMAGHLGTAADVARILLHWQVEDIQGSFLPDMVGESAESWAACHIRESPHQSYVLELVSAYLGSKVSSCTQEFVTHYDQALVELAAPVFW